jgi:ribosomal protein L24E
MRLKQKKRDGQLNKLDYAFNLIEKLAEEMLKDKPDPDRIKWITKMAKSLRDTKE